MVSVVVLTKNEETDLANCLTSINWCNDVHILDSGSTDNTLAIAQAFNASIHTNPFTSFGQQRNFALDNFSFRNEWVLFLDADEACTGAFYQAVINAINNANDETAGFYCCWKMMLANRWLKHCDNFPKWQFRILRCGRARFTDFGHGQKEHQVNGTLLYIKTPYLHYGFSKGWAHWIERHNRYSSQEAAVRLHGRPAFKNVFSKHGSIRNPALRSWLSALPGWPFLRFLQAYLFNLGFTEGIPGFVYCVNMAYYEFLIKIKIDELKKIDKRK